MRRDGDFTLFAAEADALGGGWGEGGAAVEGHSCVVVCRLRGRRGGDEVGGEGGRVEEGSCGFFCRGVKGCCEDGEVIIPCAGASVMTWSSDRASRLRRSAVGAGMVAEYLYEVVMVVDGECGEVEIDMRTGHFFE